MCELFGFSASRPMAGRDTPLAAFPQRGGLVADNPDGWGLAWWESASVEPRFEVAKEPTPGWQSPLFGRLAETLVTDLVVGHVRKARFPPVNSLSNTHPFLRSCCGRHWVFAHNGLVPDVVDAKQTDGEPFCYPEGETDSEFAFCHLLGYLNGHCGVDWPDEVARVSESIAASGKFNFLLSDGEYLVAYGHDRLHFLESTDGEGRIALVATEPLSDEVGWTAFAPGELRIYRAGVRTGGMQTHPPAPVIGQDDS